MKTRTKTWVVLGSVAALTLLLSLRTWRRQAEIRAVEARLVAVQALATAAVDRKAASGSPSTSGRVSDVGDHSPSPSPTADSASRESLYRDALNRLAATRPAPAPGPRLLPPTNMWIVLPELMSDPEYARLDALRRRWELEIRQNGLLAGLDLDEATRARVANAMTEYHAQLSDLKNLTAEAGLDQDKVDRSVRNRLLSIRGDSTKAMIAEMKGVLGERDYARYEAASKTHTVRTEIVDRLQTRLSYSRQPLTREQLAQLTDQLGAIPPVRGVPPRLETLSDQNIEQMAGILQPEQVDALRALRAERRTAAQISEIVGFNVPMMN